MVRRAFSLVAIHVTDENGGPAHHGCFEPGVLEAERSLVASTSYRMTSIVARHRRDRELECGGERAWQWSWGVFETESWWKVRVKFDLKQSGHLSCRPMSDSGLWRGSIVRQSPGRP